MLTFDAKRDRRGRRKEAARVVGARVGGTQRPPDALCAAALRALLSRPKFVLLYVPKTLFKLKVC